MSQNVEIQTHDETLLRGLFFAAGPKAPVVIMSPGVRRIESLQFLAIQPLLMKFN